MLSNDYTDEVAQNWLKSLLHTTIVEVKFEKVDGTIRDMKCTLRTDLLPPPEEVEENDDSEEKPKRKVSPDVLRVWDLEKEAWRSFRWDKIKSISFEV